MEKVGDNSNNKSKWILRVFVFLGTSWASHGGHPFQLFHSRVEHLFPWARYFQFVHTVMRTSTFSGNR